MGNSVIKLVLKGARKDAPEAFMQIDGVQGAEISGINGSTIVDVTIPSDMDLRENVFRKAVEKDFVILEMSISSTNLEDVFRKLTLTQNQGGGSK